MSETNESSEGVDGMSETNGMEWTKITNLTLNLAVH
jgi:hypothetical protein